MTRAEIKKEMARIWEWRQYCTMTGTRQYDECTRELAKLESELKKAQA